MAPVAASRIVGVLGGMGPAATADFHARLIAATPAERDQDHLRLIIDSNPHVPCRNAALAGQGPSPGPALAEMARGLERAGAQVLVMPCNAAHGWADDIRAATSLPFLDMVEGTVDAALDARPGIGAAGVLAADACLDGRLYHRAFAARGVEVVSADLHERHAFMALLRRIKRGDTGREVRLGMAALAEALIARGAQVVIAGCTEIPLVLDASQLAVPLINSTDVLVRRTLGFALG